MKMNGNEKTKLNIDYRPSLQGALQLLGGLPSEEAIKVGLMHPLPNGSEMKQTDKAPVFLMVAKEHLNYY